MVKRFGLIIILYLFAQLSPLAVSELVSTLALEPATQNAILINYQVIIFILALVGAIFILKKEDEFERKEGQASGLMTVIWTILGLFMAWFGQGIAVVIQNFILGEQVQSQNTLNLMDLARTFPVVIILIAIAGPIFEEIIFRRIIFGELYKRTNFLVAGTVSGLIFAIVHFDFTHLLVYFTMSFVFAFIYVQSKRLIVPILAHVLMNTFVVIIQLLFYEQIMEVFEQVTTILFLPF